MNRSTLNKGIDIYLKRCVSCTVRFKETVPVLNLKFVCDV